MRYKQGGISLLTSIFVITIVGLLVWYISGDRIKTAYGSIRDPLMEKLGVLDADDESEEIEVELLEIAQAVFDDFKTKYESCRVNNDLRCGCGTMDFIRLSSYSIKLTNTGVGGGRTTSLSLLDSTLSQVGPSVTVPSFTILPKSIKDDSSKYAEYRANNNYVIFSLANKITYGVPGIREERIEGDMERIFFSKREPGITTFDDSSIQTCEARCPAYAFCGNYNVNQCGDCKRAREDMGCFWETYDGEGARNDECINSGKAPALVVKIDTEETITQVWDFRLTSNTYAYVGENQFRLDNFDHPNTGEECVVLAVEEDGDSTDNAQVWYVKPGSLIERREVGRLWDGLIGPVSNCEVCNAADFCVNQCSEKRKASADPGIFSFTVGGEWYSGNSFMLNNHCDDRCPLLETAGATSGSNYWMPKYELLCDDDGYWNVCNENGLTVTATVDDTPINYECSHDPGAGWTGRGMWTNGPAKEAIGTRILHVKIDPFSNPDDTSVKKRAFYLTDKKDLPISDIDNTYRVFRDVGKNMPSEPVDKKLCNVFSVNEEGGGGTDHVASWYIFPGGRIMTLPDANEMFTGINGKIQQVKYDGGKPRKKGSPYEGDSSESVGDTDYSISTDDDECGSEKRPCNLLARKEDKYMFIPKYELLCDDDGYWRVCEISVENKPIEANDVSYTCQRRHYTGSSPDIITWGWR
tara:strand:+ start:2506 stop:4593 length:2088 start_codon:yes stop_codon:yes gene_type:complete